jgi:hypothetical protein
MGVIEPAATYEPASPREHGAVYTPAWIARRVVAKTLAPLVQDRDPEAILALRVLDPACGDGAFLREVQDYLAAAILAWFDAHPRDRRRKKFIAETGPGPALAPAVARRIVTGCLWGMDIDPLAVDAARLRSRGLRVRHGNSLLATGAAFGPETADGFDAVVGNPPYIEVKRYKAWLPALHQYLRESGRFETTRRGKADVAMAFMEQGLRLLRADGRLGFIISNRFFRTAYGQAARAWLCSRRAVAEIEDFLDLQVFPGRTTYTAIVILQPDRPRLRYRAYATLERARAGVASVDRALGWDAAGAGVWAFDQPELMAVHEDLARRHGTIGAHGRLKIAVGLQTLYGKLYQLAPQAVDAETVTGVNGKGETVTLERAALRPLARNRGFYPFRRDHADAWVIFPYQIVDGRAMAIGWREFADRFPRAARYLRERRDEIIRAVATEPGPDRWHLYTRPQNLVVQARPKVLFPMTIEDPAAAVDLAGDVYQDNVNVNSISWPGASPAQLQAVAAVFNSTLFSALARARAGFNDAGWRKFNRQYAAVVPWPAAVSDDAGTVVRLAALAREISARQAAWLAGTGEQAAIAALWGRLDDAVEEVYGLTRAQKRVLPKYPRRVGRLELLTRRGVRPESV